ncbi:MAG: hypothetical protein L6R40_006166 [Gallowayella cf. fulva]|nr:MAG: hypothetical protein L6R40_006166 [Xanthomendoza cf. fulva]
MPLSKRPQTMIRYIQVLPQPDDFSQPAIPLVWNDEDISWLQGTYLEDSVSNYRKDLELHWSEAMEVLKRADWDVSSYTIELFMWAYFAFNSRQFPSVALAGDSGSLKPEYRPLVEEGVYSDDGPRILLPLIDGIDHIQEAATDWHFDEEGLAVSKPFEMKPGQRICFPYDKADQRLNNTTLLRDFGFILSNNESCEATLTFPFDPSVALHPSHSIFSVASTVDDCYASADYTYIALVSVRSPSRDVRGPVNIAHETPALLHFHPLLVSMVSFRVANLLERVALRNDPFKLPTERLKKSTIGYLVRHMQSMLQSMTEHDKLLKTPQNERQRRAHAYRQEQEEILQEIIEKIQEDS